MYKYFIASDIHSFFTIYYNALLEKGFDINNPKHILIICGDLFDRGQESRELLDFLLSLPKERLILIRGNHEDLLEHCLSEIEKGYHPSYHHWSNKTVDTIAQLTNINKYDFYDVARTSNIREKLKDYFELVSRAVDYYELGNYIFVHGWVPYILQDTHDPSGELSIISKPIIKLDADKFMWDDARWHNGMQEAARGIIIPGKTIVCGHFHTGWGHFNIHKEGETQYDNFDIYYDEGVVALDTCTVYSNKINILVLENI